MEHVQNILVTVQRTLENPAINYKSFVLNASWALWGLETYVL